MATPSFDDFADVYATMIDWPRRLANEAPFFQHWFQLAQAQEVLDVACGTGHHAALFAEWGLRVEGRDKSAEMISQARVTHGDSARLRWLVCGFEDVPPKQELYAAAVCVGNSLALATDMTGVERAITNLLDSIRNNGVVIAHVLNLWRLPDGPCVWQKCQRTHIRDRDTLIIKGVHRSAERGFVELLVVPIAEPAAVQTESVPFLGLEADLLRSMAQHAGARRVEFFGDYGRRPYDRTQSADLIMVARK